MRVDDQPIKMVCAGMVIPGVTLLSATVSRNFSSLRHRLRSASSRIATMVALTAPGPPPDVVPGAKDWLAAVLAVRLADGHTPDDPLSDDDLAANQRSIAMPRIGVRAVNESLARCWELDTASLAADVLRPFSHPV